MSRSPSERHAALERLFGAVAEDSAFESLEDRAHDAAHLDEAQFNLLLAEEPEPEPESEAESEGEAADEVSSDEPDAIKNLKRHILFCDICAREFLKRSGPKAEALFEELDLDEERREVSRRRLFISLGVAAILAVLILLIWNPFKQEEEPSFEPVNFSVRPTSAGTGDSFGLAASKDRLFMYLAPTDEKGESLTRPWLYVYLVSNDRVVAMHPKNAPGAPATLGLFPPGGWEDPGGEQPRSLLVLLTADRVPLLTSKEGSAQLLRDLRRQALEGRPPKELLATLQSLSGATGGQAFFFSISK